MSLRGAAAIVGFAELAPKRTTDETLLGLLATVATDAIADAGLTLGEVDGLLLPTVHGISEFAPAVLAEHLGLRVRFAELVDLGGASAAGMVWRAAAAIASGMCTTCVCVTAASRRPRRPEPRSTPRARPSLDRSPNAEFDAPYGMVGANAGYAQIAMRYQHEYAVSGEQLAKIAVHQRDNAGVNPDALFREPISVDDVLASQVICDPLHLLEIVLPVAGGAAIVVTSPGRAADSPNHPAWLLGAGEVLTHSSLTAAPSLTHTAVADVARSAFSMAGVAPSEIGLASLYDCYTIAVLLTLEDAGFCAKGEGGAFLEAHDLRWSGDFPLNTHGGQLSFGQAGYAGGMSHVTEAVRQLTNRANGRQLADLELAYVNGNGGLMSEQVGLVLGASR
jgi:acetyl-CoA acetyltransferase